MARLSAVAVTLPALFPSALFLSALFTGCSRPVPPPSRQSVDGVTVTLTSGFEMHTGDNTAAVTVMDAATGGLIGNANITAEPDMRSPTMTGVSTSGRAQGNGVYTIPVRLPIATKYALVLHVQRPGQPTRDFSFPIEAD